MKAGRWDRSSYMGTSMTGKTLAIYGFGKVRGWQGAGLARCGAVGVARPNRASLSCTATYQHTPIQNTPPCFPLLPARPPIPPGRL